MGASTEDFDLWLGKRATRQVAITDGMISAFADLSGDHSVIHISDTHARQHGFKSRVAHGALLSSFVSAVLGMELPGGVGVLQELSMRFHCPCYAGDVVTVTARVKEVFASVRTIRIGITLHNQDGTVVARGNAQSGILGA